MHVGLDATVLDAGWGDCANYGGVAGEAYEDLEAADELARARRAPDLGTKLAHAREQGPSMIHGLLWL